jgi:hypothetical protein
LPVCSYAQQRRNAPPAAEWLYCYKIHQRACTKSHQTNQRTSVQAIIPADHPPYPHSRHTPTSSPHQPKLPILPTAPAIYRNISFFPVCPDRPRFLVIIRQV